MDSDELDIKESIKKLKKVCKVIRMVCLVCLILFALGWLLFTCMMIIGFVSNKPDSAGLDEIAYLTLFGILAIFMFIIALRMFSDILAGESPFSMKQVKRLRLTGTLFLIYTALEALLSVSFAYDLFGGAGNLGIVTGENAVSPFIQVNVFTLIVAIVCFGFAVIFKYGVLLQQISDDTL